MSRRARQKKVSRNPSAPPGPSAPWFVRALTHPVTISFLLALVTLAVYWPVIGYDFVNFDDDVYVTENYRVLHGLSLSNIGWAFSNLEAGFWHPLTWLSLLLDATL